MRSASGLARRNQDNTWKIRAHAVPALGGQLAVSCCNHPPPHLADEKSELEVLAAFRWVTQPGGGRAWVQTQEGEGPAAHSALAEPQALKQVCCGPRSRGTGQQDEGEGAPTCLHFPEAATWNSEGPCQPGCIARQGPKATVDRSSEKGRAPNQVPRHFLREAFPAVLASLPGGLPRVPSSVFPN